MAPIHTRSAGTQVVPIGAVPQAAEYLHATASRSEVHPLLRISHDRQRKSSADAEFVPSIPGLAQTFL
jgi:hypothetical protein